MRISLFLFTFFFACIIHAQNITIKVEIYKEATISEVVCALHIYDFSNHPNVESLKLKILKDEDFSSYAKKNNIEILRKYNSNKNVELSIENLKYFLFRISDNEKLTELNKFLADYINDDLIRVDYQIENFDRYEQVIFDEAMEQAKLEATKMAKQLKRNLDSIYNITLTKESNEQGQNIVGSWNLNKAIGWTAYPPLSPYNMNSGSPLVDMSTFITRQYEITFSTKNLD